MSISIGKQIHAAREKFMGQKTKILNTSKIFTHSARKVSQTKEIPLFSSEE